MRVYLVRHGEAKREDVDPERHLTDRGVDEVRRIATEAIDALGVRPARIAHSNKARARQTAEIWAGMVGTDISESDGLAPNDDPSVWGARLGAEANDVMLVGHLPHLERLAGLLVTGDPDHPVVGFSAGALVVVERDEGRWRVVATRS